MPISRASSRRRFGCFWAADQPRNRCPHPLHSRARPFTRLEICAEAVRMGLFPVPSEVAIRQINRKIVLSGLSALAATGALPLSAQRRQRRFGFSFSIDGQRFGAVVTARSEGANLVTIRTFDRRIRAAVMVPMHQSQARSVPLAGGWRAVVSIVEQGPAMQGQGCDCLAFPNIHRKAAGNCRPRDCSPTSSMPRAAPSGPSVTCWRSSPWVWLRALCMAGGGQVRGHLLGRTRCDPDRARRYGPG
jgi:hypothetical protein